MADEFVERVRAITSRRALQANPRVATDTWVYLELNHDLGRYSATLQLRGRQQGSRVLSDVGANCESLADAVAVTLAVLLDAGEPVAVVEARPAVTPVSKVEPVAARRDPRFAALLGGGLGLGLLSDAAPWATLGVETVVGRRFRFGLGGATAMPQRLHYLQGYTEVSLAWGWVQGCARALGNDAGIELMLCVSPMLGALSGSGERYDFSNHKRWAWLALSGGPRLEGPLAAPSFWWLSVAGLAPLTLRGFAVAVDGKPHDSFVTPRVAAIASVGMGVRF